MAKTTTKKTGRPSALTPRVKARIFRSIQEGASLAEAAEMAGIGRSTLMEWKARGADPQEKDPEFLDFLDGIQRARTRGKHWYRKQLRKAGEEDWRAWAWLAERIHPDSFALRIRVLVEEQLTDVLRALQTHFQDRPELYEEIVAAIAAGAGGSGAEPAEEGPGGPDAGSGEALHPAPPPPEAGGVPPPRG